MLPLPMTSVAPQMQSNKHYLVIMLPGNTEKRRVRSTRSHIAYNTYAGNGYELRNNPAKPGKVRSTNTRMFRLKPEGYSQSSWPSQTCRYELGLYIQGNLKAGIHVLSHFHQWSISQGADAGRILACFRVRRKKYDRADHNRYSRRKQNERYCVIVVVDCDWRKIMKQVNPRFHDPCRARLRTWSSIMRSPATNIY